MLEEINEVIVKRSKWNISKYDIIWILVFVAAFGYTFFRALQRGDKSAFLQLCVVPTMIIMVNGFTYLTEKRVMWINGVLMVVFIIEKDFIDSSIILMGAFAVGAFISQTFKLGKLLGLNVGEEIIRFEKNRVTFKLFNSDEYMTIPWGHIQEVRVRRRGACIIDVYIKDEYMHTYSHENMFGRYKYKFSIFGECLDLHGPTMAVMMESSRKKGELCFDDVVEEEYEVDVRV